MTAGDRVLVHGGGGGVGHVAIQIAKALGAYVITTAGGSKRAFAEGLGADEVIDYTTTDFAEQVRDVDVVLDTIGGDAVERSLGVLRPGGHLVTAVAEEDAGLAAAYEAAGMRFSGIAVEPDPIALHRLADLATQGRLRVHVQETFPFDRVTDAHRLLDTGHLQGKLVLTPPDSADGDDHLPPSPPLAPCRTHPLKVRVRPPCVRRDWVGRSCVRRIGGLLGLVRMRRFGSRVSAYCLCRVRFQRQPGSG
ncbi:zinc-binding dehydrogenase [Nonomuraea salmonea]|uniref:zinc-binding dehydrogenase n=1 Tax=Nonomuraea salmonea TaxID=46181 RepID=UPI0031F1072C